MKHLKKFNESQSDIEYHKLMIQDVFQDVFDEYVIEKGIIGRSSGLCYSITDHTENKWRLECKVDEIVLLIWKGGESPEYVKGWILSDPLIKKIIKSRYLSDHIKRLSTMGYKVKHNYDPQIDGYRGALFDVETDGVIKLVIGI